MYCNYYTYIAQKSVKKIHIYTRAHTKFTNSYNKHFIAIIIIIITYNNEQERIKLH